MSKSKSIKAEKSNYKALQKIGKFLDWSGFIILLTSPLSLFIAFVTEELFAGILAVIAGLMIMSYGKMLIAINAIELNTRILQETIKSDNNG